MFNLKKQSIYTLLTDIFCHLKWHELSLGIIVSSICINILAMVLPLVMLQFFDRIISNHSIDTLILLTGLVFIAILFESLLKLIRASVNHWASARYEHHASINAFKSVLNTNLQDLSQKGTGAYLDRLSDIFAMKDFFGGQALSLLVDLPFVIIYFTLIYYIGGNLVLVPLVLLFAFLVIANIFGNKLQQGIKSRKEDDDKRYNFIIEILTGIQSIKSYALESFMNRRYERLQLSSVVIEKKNSLLNLDSMTASQVILQVTTILVVSVGSYKIIQGQMTIGTLAACTLLANRSLSPLGSAMMFWKRIQSIAVSQQRLSQLNRTKEEEKEKSLTPDLKGEIKLSNINFKFNESEEIFKDLNLIIKENECISIMGEGSSGKTALMKLILGLYTPNNGSIEIDNKDLHQYDKVELRKKIAYLPQQASLFNGSILENLTLFDEKEIPYAIELVSKMKFQGEINKLESGYESQVGHRVIEFIPEGIKQQIITIQNLIHDPEIILFDEANTSVDLNADKKFIDLLKYLKGKKTLIIISHRPSLLKIADTHYIIDKGKLIRRNSL